MRVELTDAQVRTLAKAYESGQSIKALAEQNNICRRALRRHLANAGVRLRTRAEANVLAHSQVISDEQIAGLKRAYESGQSIDALAEQYNVDRKAVRRHLANAGVRLRTRADRPKRTKSLKSLPAEQAQELARAYEEEGASVKALAEKYDVSAGVIRRHLANAGVRRRTRSEVAALSIPVRVTLPARQVEALVKEYKEGRGIKSLSMQYRINPKVVTRYLTEAGIPLRTRPSAGTEGASRTTLPDEQIARMRQAYEAGQSLAALARQHGVSWPVVERHLVDAGVQLRGGYEMTGLTVAARRATAGKAKAIDEMAAAYKAGESARAIGARYGMSGMTVLRYLRAAGVQIRSRQEGIRLSKVGRPRKPR